MKVAIPTWGGSVSPVFDVARTLSVVEVGDDGRRLTHTEPLGETGLPARVRRLKSLGVDVLICCGISQPLATMLTAAGVRVVPAVVGPVDQVLEGFLTGQWPQRRFAMPGGRGRRRRMRGRRGWGGGRGRQGMERNWT